MEKAFTRCIADPQQTRQLTGRGLCHGTSGLLATGRRIADDALTPTPLAPLLNLHHRTGATVDGVAGFLDGSAGWLRRFDLAPP
jgi:hypothetical protein